jgi:hypothetical protein
VAPHDGYVAKVASENGVSIVWLLRIFSEVLEYTEIACVLCFNHIHPHCSARTTASTSASNNNSTCCTGCTTIANSSSTSLLFEEPIHQVVVAR